MVATVGGAMKVQGNTHPEPLDLPALTSVGGNLDIYDNPRLPSISLGSLANVTGQMNVYYSSGQLANAAVLNISLPALRTVGNRLYFYNHPLLSELHLPVLETTGYSILLSVLGVDFVTLPSLRSSAMTLRVDSNPSMVSASFPALQYLGEYLYVVNSPALRNLSAPVLQETRSGVRISVTGLQWIDLSGLQTSRGYFYVLLCPDLEEVVMPRLQSVNGQLFVSVTGAKFVDFPALETVTGNGDFNFILNPRLRAISAPRLHNITSQMYMRDCPELESVDVSGLVHVAEDLVFQTAPKLHTLLLPRLEYVGEWLQIGKGLDSLVRFEAPRLTTNILPTLIWGNPNLTTVLLPRLNFTRGLWLQDLPSLVQLDISSLTVAETYFEVFGVPLLEAVSAPLLESVGTVFYLTGPALWRLDFPALTLTVNNTVVLNVTSLCCPLAAALLTRLGSTVPPTECLDGPCLRCEPAPPQLSIAHGSLPGFDDRLGWGPQVAACEEGYELQGDPHTCQPDGTWAGATQSCTLVVCPPGAADCLVSATATACTSGAQPENGRCCWNGGRSCASTGQLPCTAHNSSCVDCPPAHYLHPDTLDCQACPPGASSCSDGATATACASGRLPENGRCCASSGPSCAADDRLSCAAHNGTCLPCAPDQYFNRDLAVCSACPAGASACLSADVSTACTSGAQPESGRCCDHGQLGPGAGAGPAASCAALGRAVCANHGGPCQPCAPDHYFDTRTLACIACGAGASSCNSTRALSCLPGYSMAPEPEARCCMAPVACPSLHRGWCGSPGSPCSGCLPGYSATSANATSTCVPLLSSAAEAASLPAVPPGAVRGSLPLTEAAADPADPASLDRLLEELARVAGVPRAAIIVVALGRAADGTTLLYFDIADPGTGAGAAGNAGATTPEQAFAKITAAEQFAGTTRVTSVSYVPGGAAGLASTGALVGIVLAVVLAVAGIAAGVWWYRRWLARKRHVYHITARKAPPTAGLPSSSSSSSRCSAPGPGPGPRDPADEPDAAASPVIIVNTFFITPEATATDTQTQTQP